MNSCRYNNYYTESMTAARKKSQKVARNRKKKLARTRRREIFKTFQRLTQSKSGGSKTKSGDRSRSKGRVETSTAENRLHSPDFYLLAIPIALALFGWIMIYSGSFYVASQRPATILSPYNPFHFFILHGIYLTGAAIACYIFYRLPLKSFRYIAALGLIGVIILLIIVLILPTEVNGAKLWIRIGTFSLQPSEFAKPILILAIAGAFAKDKDWKTWGQYLTGKFLPFATITLTVVGLIFFGNDLATAALVAAICLAVYFLSSDNSLHNITVMGAGAITAALGVIFTFTASYRVARVDTYLQFLIEGTIADPLNTGYQLRQILIAVGTGGLFGYGFGQSRQKYLYLQETAFTDTIFAVVAEEFGLIGGLLIITGFLIFALRGLKVARHCRTRYEGLVTAGIVIWITLQALIHLGVNVGLIPLTGMTLPFMSYGGSSLLASAIGLGILLNISRRVKLN